MGGVTEAQIKSAPSVTWSDGETAIAEVTTKRGNPKWCGVIKMWKESPSNEYKGVHGRRNANEKAGDWAVGDKIQIVVTCPGKIIYNVDYVSIKNFTVL